MKFTFFSSVLFAASLGATTFSDSNFQAGNYNAPVTYNNGALTSSVTFNTPNLTWTSTYGTFNPVPNAGFSIIHPGWSYDPGVLGPVLGITASATFAMNASGVGAESDYRVFIAQGGNLYRAIVDGAVFGNGTFNTVSSGVLNAANFVMIGANGLITTGNPNLAQAFSLGFGAQFQNSDSTSLSATYSNVTIDVLNANSVPEPGTFLAGALALAVVARFRACRYGTTRSTR
jgi:hypothetical protein